MIMSLIGPMGAGKSTVSRLLATRLNYTFADTDQWIETTKGLSVSDIFATEGEARFREYESQALDCLLQQQNLIIATGGGIVVSEKNRAYLLQTHVIYLQVSVAVELERLKQDQTRPLLNHANKEATLINLQNARNHWYTELANCTISTDRLNPDEVAAKILAFLPSAFLDV